MNLERGREDMLSMNYVDFSAIAETTAKVHGHELRDLETYKDLLIMVLRYQVEAHPTVFGTTKFMSPSPSPSNASIASTVLLPAPTHPLTTMYPKPLVSALY